MRALVYEASPALEGLDVLAVPGDVLSPETLEPAFDGADWVFHLAARIFLDRDAGGMGRRVNVDGTAHVVDACLRCGVKRLVHFSSIHASSPFPRTTPVDETRPLCLGIRTPGYDQSKAEAEVVIQAGVERGLDAVILCPTGVIGPNDFALSHMGRLLLALYHRRVPVLVRGGFNWVDVRDVCASAIAAAERGRTGERYLLPGHYQTLLGVAGLVSRVTGARVPRWAVPMGAARAGAAAAAVWGKLRGRPGVFTAAALHAVRNHQLVCGEKAASELGHTARPLLETMLDTFAWFRAHDLLPSRGTAGGA